MISFYGVYCFTPIYCILKFTQKTSVKKLNYYVHTEKRIDMSWYFQEESPDLFPDLQDMYFQGKNYLL